MKKVLIDSSCWIEFFKGGKRIKKIEKYMSSFEKIVTPIIVVYEVYKKIKSIYSEEIALSYSSQLEKTELVNLDIHLTRLAADISIKNNLAMADAFIYATSELKDAQIVTFDSDFKDLDNVIYLKD